MEYELTISFEWKQDHLIGGVFKMTIYILI